MAFGDLIFGKQLMLQTSSGKTLFSPAGTEVLLSKAVEGDAACVQLVRNGDGTISIWSMRNNLYLSVGDYEDSDDGEEAAGENDISACRFDAREIEDPQKFCLKFVGKLTFTLESQGKGNHLSRCGNDVMCDAHFNYPPALWKLKEPASSVRPPSLCTEVDGAATESMEVASFTSSPTLAEQASNRRHEAIMRLALAGKSPEYINDLVDRMYNVRTA
ncbi:hypothetical protein PHYPSEUDO_002746 [Phytophthora pseudosyringae]|uniref:Uncharacterized protein n=1 Tax=Phytophthora pseudosyringae TaxID=221518 RepID=A0A8T1VWF0_9STRA|nr:hypothetical protein PHYPSEUDO_002746 [Phytophthora pseudosyringae]